MRMMAITVNGCAPGNIFPAFILGSAALATGDELIIFFTPAGAPMLVKGAMEKVNVKGLPNLVELVDSVKELGGRIMMCELALEVKGIKREDIIDGVEIVGATTFVVEAKNATLTFSF